MPWALIIEVVFFFINMLFKDATKRAEAKKRFIDYVAARTSAQKGPKEAYDSYREQIDAYEKERAAK